MPRSYTVREFFRQMPTDLLHRYFGARRLFVDLNFDALPQTQPDTLFDAWIALPPETRASIDAEFREIFDLSGEKGFRAIQDEAAFRFRQDPADLKAFVAQLADLPGHFERAMTTFLDHPDLWPGALTSRSTFAQLPRNSDSPVGTHCNDFYLGYRNLPSSPYSLSGR